MTGFIVSVFPFRNRVSLLEAFEGLELGEGKPSRPVLRGPGGRKAAWLLGSKYIRMYGWLIGNWPIAPHLPCFPLGFYVGKIESRSNGRIVTVHSLNAKITWLKHCRNLGHGKLTAARGQL